MEDDQESKEPTSDKLSLKSGSMTQMSSTALPSGKRHTSTNTKGRTASATSKSSPGEFQLGKSEYIQTHSSINFYQISKYISPKSTKREG
jgi:hypothetical protein